MLLKRGGAGHRLGNYRERSLFHDFEDLTGTYRTTALTDCETQTLVQGNRVDQLHGDGHVVAGHHHVDACGQVNLTRYVHRTQIELGTIVVVERRVTEES